MRSARKTLLDMSLRMNAATRAMERLLDSGGILSEGQMERVYWISTSERVLRISNKKMLNEIIDVETDCEFISVMPDGSDCPVETEKHDVAISLSLMR